MSDATPAPKRHEPRLKPNMLVSAPHFMHQYIARVPNDTLLEDVLTPAWWAHHWGAFVTKDNKATPILGGIVHVMREDMSLDVILRVVGVGQGYVKMRPIFTYENNDGLERSAASAAADEGPDMPVLPEGYKSFHVPRGDNPGHAVRLVATGDVVVKGKGSKREAVLEAIKHHAAAHAPAK